MDDPRPAATQCLMRVPVVLASTGADAPCPSYPCAAARTAARIVSFWRHNPEISDIFCGPNMAGVAVHIRDG
jgi:hypothetical protein